MRTIVAGGAVAVAVALVAAAPATAVDPEPANLGVALIATFDDATGQLHRNGAVAGRVFVLPTYVGSYQLPTDPDGRPIDTKGVRSATYTIAFAAGLAVQAAAPIRAYGSSGTSTTCVGGCAVSIPDGKLGVNTHYRLLAGAPGTYSVTMQLTSTSRPDPDPANDRVTLVIVVKAAAVVAGRSVAVPAVPRAGRLYSLTLPLTRAGTPVTPASVRCSATLAGRALTGSRVALAGRARCAWRLPGGSAGKALRVGLVATAGGRAFRAARVATVVR